LKLERLLLRGVRSFADPVEVDFARLGEQGLFAIVGPTGAGKSTLLDGVFLALFGRSPRGEASECVAAGANELVVRLEVATTLDGAPTRVAIERAWRWSRKRGTDELDVRGAARHAPVRVERRTEADTWEPIDFGGERPETFLKRAIVRVSIDDFQQAVVLPQGEFGALLGAKPAERRALVASLFRTEHLGQPLGDVLKRREAEVKAEMDRLGEAAREVAVDDAAAAAAVAAARTSADEARELGAALERAERFTAEVRRARERCAARDIAAASLAEMAGVEERLAERRVESARARRAALASDAVDALAAAEPDQREAEAVEGVARRAAAEAGQALRVAVREHGVARSLRVDQAPALQTRLERARAAAVRERAVEALEATAAERAAAADLTDARAVVAARAHERAEQDRSARAAEAARLAADLERTRVDERERAIVLAAVALAERVAAALRVDKAIAHELARVDAAVAASRASLVNAGEATGAAEASADAAQEALAAATLEAERERGAVDRAQVGLDDARRRGAAADLSLALRDGSPCPVCGAREHPGQDHGASAIAVVAAERALDASRRFAEHTERARLEAEVDAQSAAEALRAALTREGELERAATTSEEERVRVVAACSGDGAEGHARPRSVDEAEVNAARAATKAELALASLDAPAQAEARAVAASLEDAERRAAELAARARAADAMLPRVRAAEARRVESAGAVEALRVAQAAVDAELGQARHEAAAALRLAREGARELAELLVAVEPAGQHDLFARADHPTNAAGWTARLERELAEIVEGEAAAEAALAAARDQDARRSLEAREATGRRVEATRTATRARAVAASAVARAGFSSIEDLGAARRDPAALDELDASLAHDTAELARRTAVLDARRRDVHVEVDAAEAATVEAALGDARRGAAAASAQAAAADARAAELARRRARAAEIRASVAALAPRAARLTRLRHVVAGGLLSELAAERHLELVLTSAEQILRSVSGDRYGILRRADGSFAVRDAAHAGLVRPPSTLSGGETFLVSLSLALALSERIQVAGRTRFDFFFLDEGFGSLDAATLDLALGALERLRDAGRVIGMISHVPAVEERMPRRLRVVPSRPRGHARVVHELP
jgi:exonuclease SbcC